MAVPVVLHDDVLCSRRVCPGRLKKRAIRSSLGADRNNLSPTPALLLLLHTLQKQYWPKDESPENLSADAVVSKVFCSHSR